jgi:hypothetical protein
LCPDPDEEPMEETRCCRALDAAVPEVRRSRRLAECSAERSLVLSRRDEDSESELEPECCVDGDGTAGGLFSSGWALEAPGLPLRARGEKALPARLTGMERSGEGRSSVSGEEARFRVSVGGIGEPLAAEGRDFDRNPA